ncbi:MAG: Mov34/MPN/PAD-1 family protein [Candidatus Methylomirabilia bacterium]
MAAIEFWSSDRRFGVRFGEEEIQSIRDLCMAANRGETGGILIGFYTERHDCAVVTAVTGPTSDSRVGRTWFYRGVRGLQNLLDRLWHRRRHYYLGEWHFHPGAVPHPSPVDVDQLKQIAASQEYRCPEPVLLVVGGDPAAHWSMRSYVFPGGQDPLPLTGPGDFVGPDNRSDGRNVGRRTVS